MSCTADVTPMCCYGSGLGARVMWEAIGERYRLIVNPGPCLSSPRLVSYHASLSTSVPSLVDEAVV